MVLIELQRFLIQRKFRLLEIEKRSSSGTRSAILGQLQAIDSLLIYLSSKQTEEDMAKLELSLGEQIKPSAEVRSRSGHDGELTEIIAKLATQVKVGTGQQMILGQGMKAKSIATKIYNLRDEGKIPKAILPSLKRNELWLTHLTPEELKDFEARRAKAKR